MKANEFVKKFGLDLAKRDIAALDSGFIKREDFFEHYGFDILDELKILVESHNAVDFYGGLQQARKVAHSNCFEFPHRLLKAILDVESCQ